MRLDGKKVRGVVTLERVDCRLDGENLATVEINEEQGFATCRPHRGTLYTVTLRELAEMIAYRSAKNSLGRK